MIICDLFIKVGMEIVVVTKIALVLLYMTGSLRYLVNPEVVATYLWLRNNLHAA